MKITEKVKMLAVAGVLTIVGIGAALAQKNVFAYDMGGVKSGMNAIAPSDSTISDLPTVVNNIINIILYIVGILAVVMVIFGGIQYATSAGDTAKVTKAKNTILYGIVGLVIAILAYAIVNFVIQQIM